MGLGLTATSIAYEYNDSVVRSALTVAISFASPALVQAGVIFSNPWILVTGVAIAVLIPVPRAPILDEVCAAEPKEAPWCFPRHRRTPRSGNRS
jgi:hypothetical protein